jgi:hypothetical protein
MKPNKRKKARSDQPTLPELDQTKKLAASTINVRLAAVC